MIKKREFLCLAGVCFSTIVANVVHIQYVKCTMIFKCQTVCCNVCSDRVESINPAVLAGFLVFLL